MTKSKQLQRALRGLVPTTVNVLVTAARIRVAQRKIRLRNLREQRGKTDTVLLANIAEVKTPCPPCPCGELSLRVI